MFWLLRTKHSIKRNKKVDIFVVKLHYTYRNLIIIPYRCTILIEMFCLLDICNIKSNTSTFPVRFCRSHKRRRLPFVALSNAFCLCAVSMRAVYTHILIKYKRYRRDWMSLSSGPFYHVHKQILSLFISFIFRFTYTIY